MSLGLSISAFRCSPFYNMDIQWFKAISGKEKKKKNTHTLSNFLRNNFVDKGIADLQGALLGSDMPSTVTHQRLQPAEDGLCDAPEGLLIRRDNLQSTSCLRGVPEVQEGKRCER